MKKNLFFTVLLYVLIFVAYDLAARGKLGPVFCFYDGHIAATVKSENMYRAESLGLLKKCFSGYSTSIICLDADFFEKMYNRIYPLLEKLFNTERVMHEYDVKDCTTALACGPLPTEIEDYDIGNFTLMIQGVFSVLKMIAQDFIDDKALSSILIPILDECIQLINRMVFIRDLNAGNFGLSAVNVWVNEKEKLKFFTLQGITDLMVGSVFDAPFNTGVNPLLTNVFFVMKAWAASEGREIGSPLRSLQVEKQPDCHD